MSYQDGELKPELLKSCTYKSATEVICEFRKGLKWSNGSEILPDDFIRSFHNFMDPKSKSMRPDLLFSVKNAAQISRGEKTIGELGITLVGSTKDPSLLFTLEKPDSEFLYNLTSPLLSPVKSTNFPSISDSANLIVPGAYKIKSWTPGKSILLEPNRFYFKSMEKAPLIEYLFISEDSVALNLYEKKELDFHRRLPTLFIPKYQGKPDFFEVPQVRFDYLGFSKDLKNFPALRKALSESIDYKELGDLYHAKPRPGCPGIPREWMEDYPCINYKLDTAKKAFAEVTEKPKDLKLVYSKQGGNDHKRSMEWIQAQWQKNLGIQIPLEEVENKIFVAQLESKPPTIFRKGLAFERPTCLAALEAFLPKNLENYLKIDDIGFQKILAELKASSDNSKKRKLCSSAMHFLIDNYYLIPTGPIFFSILVQPKWKGWKLNELNQLDLSGLRLTK